MFKAALCTDEESEGSLAGNSSAALQQSPAPPQSEGSAAELADQDPAILEALQGNYKSLVNRHLPTVLQWLRVVVRVMLFCRDI